MAPHRWIFAVALALVLPSCSPPPLTVEQLLAEAYFEDRRYEWRLPSPGWPPIRQKPRSAVDRSPALVKAQALLAAQGDPLLQARAELLEGQTESAIALLRDAHTQDALIDLAVAHGLSADQGGPAAGYAAAVEYTTRALALDPANRRALFNRALAFERLGLFARAGQDWRLCLTEEKNPGWLSEIRDRRGLHEPAPFGDSDFVAVQMLAADHASFRDDPDPWFRDASRENVDTAPLVRVTQLMQDGEATEALRLADELQRLYARAPAHRLRAEYELLFAKNRRMDACVGQSSKLAREARQRNYMWLALQSELVESACLSMSGPADLAIARVRKVEKEAVKLGVEGLISKAVSYRSNMQILAGDVWGTWDDDRRLLREFLPSTSPPKRRHLSTVNYQLAAAQRGWHAAAHEFALAAAQVAAKIPNRVLEASNRHAAASAAIAAGLFSAAAREATAAQDMYRSMKASPERDRYLASLTVLQAKSVLGTGDARRAITLLEEAMPRLQTDDDRIAANESLGLAYLEAGQPRKAQPYLEACVQALRLAAPADRPRLRAGHRDAYRSLARVLLEAGNAPAALDVWLEAHGSRGAPDLVWLALPDGYAVWSKGKLQRLKVDRAATRRQAEEFTRLAASPLSALPDLRRAAQALFAQWIAPVEGWQQPSLTVLPDGELAMIPLHLLLTPAGAWWGSQSSLIHAAAPVRDDPRPLRRALAVGVSRGPAHLPPLPDSAAEAALPGQHFAATLLLDERATAQALRQHLPQAELFHFSGHGWTSPDLGGVHLADSILTPLSLRSLPLRQMKLAVLSACFSASGTNTGLANPDSLVRALLDSGAGTVLASRWAIDSAATRRWMTVFYTALSQGRDPANALRQANETMEKENAHPYYWAAFQLYQ